MLGELGEILIGLGVSLVILVIVARLLVFSRSDTEISQQPIAGLAKEHLQAPEVFKDDIDGSRPMRTNPVVGAIFVTPDKGELMNRVALAGTIAGRGIAGDRYCEDQGYWSGRDECQVTMIEGEDIDQIENATGIKLRNGEHRRNIVTQNLRLRDLVGHRFQIGSAIFRYDCPRPPCAYIQMITEPGMTKALGRRAGIGVRVLEAGEFRQGDPIVILDALPAAKFGIWLATKIRALLPAAHK